MTSDACKAPTDRTLLKAACHIRSMQALEFVNSLFVGLAISVATAYLTVRWSVKRFRSERWWELRVDAYSKVVDALFVHYKGATDELEGWYAFIEGREDGQKQLTEEERSAWRARYKESSGQIEDAVLRGSFHLSEEAVELLKELSKERKKAEHEILTGVGFGPEMMEAEEELLSEYFAKFRDLAKKDLGVRESF